MNTQKKYTLLIFILFILTVNPLYAKMIWQPISPGGGGVISSGPVGIVLDIKVYSNHNRWIMPIDYPEMRCYDSVCNVLKLHSEPGRCGYILDDDGFNSDSYVSVGADTQSSIQLGFRYNGTPTEDPEDKASIKLSIQYHTRPLVDVLHVADFVITISYYPKDRAWMIELEELYEFWELIAGQDIITNRGQVWLGKNPHMPVMGLCFTDDSEPI